MLDEESSLFFYCSFSVSQFTLYGILKGNKPDFHVAMPPQQAKPFYESLVEKFRKSYAADAVKGMIMTSGKMLVIHSSLLMMTKLVINEFISTALCNSKFVVGMHKK